MKSRKFLIFIVIAGFLAIPFSITIAIHIENRDSFCASCHTEPESAYYARSLSNPSDLASTHAQAKELVRCIDCHSGEGTKGRMISLSQGFSDLMTYLTGNYQQPATTQNPLGDQACTKCHILLNGSTANSQQITIASTSHYHIESYLNEWNLRAANPGGTCSLCHVSHSKTINANEGYIEKTITNLACDQCHRVLSGWIPPE